MPRETYTLPMEYLIFNSTFKYHVTIKIKNNKHYVATTYSF